MHLAITSYMHAHIPYSTKFWWGNILADSRATAKNLPSKISPLITKLIP